MPQFGTIKGHVVYTPGDGPPLESPLGKVEIDLTAPDSATLSWEADDGVLGLTAIPRTTFDEYVEAGKIELGA